MIKIHSRPSLAILYFISKNRNGHVTAGRLSQPPVQPGMALGPDSVQQDRSGNGMCQHLSQVPSPFSLALSADLNVDTLSRAAAAI